ncbi:alpha-tectorin-like [Anolis sagrei]|uniref:alpha-tectorin-like n=1 Tax=Anolis sagrei TaxID=38937 RepID=UPI00352203DC
MTGKVNDVFVNLPFYYEDMIQAYIRGNEAVIKTNFDLTVTFDWKSYVKVSVPSTYSNALCGPVCGEEQKLIYKGDQYCGILIRKDGPFRHCHGIIDPTPYFDGCVFDTCQYHGQHDALCNAISVYLAACQALDVQIEEWRSDTFCKKGMKIVL